MVQLISAKFGGTSVRTAEDHLAAREIVRSHAGRRAITISAMRGITDALTAWVTFGPLHAKPKIRAIQQLHGSKEAIIAAVIAEFHALVQGLKARDVDITVDIDQLFSEMLAECSRLYEQNLPQHLHHYAIGRGDIFNARIFAQVVGLEYFGATEFIVADSDGIWNAECSRQLATEMRLRERVLERGGVIGGFSARLDTDAHAVITLGRGGSDTSGTIFGNLIGADVCENWTDVEGVQTANPKIVKHTRTVRRMFFGEMNEMASRGAGVLHERAVQPAEEAPTPIPINIRSTRQPEKEGTWVVPQGTDDMCFGEVGCLTGIADMDGFTRMRVWKVPMEQGFDEKLDSVLRQFGLDWPHKTTGTNSIAVIVADDELRAKQDRLRRAIINTCGADDVEFEGGFTALSFIGAGIKGVPGVSGKILLALGDAGVYDELIDKGGSPINMIVVVKTADSARGIRAVHDAFFK